MNATASIFLNGYNSVSFTSTELKFGVVVAESDSQNTFITFIVERTVS